MTGKATDSLGRGTGPADTGAGAVAARRVIERNSLHVRLPCGAGTLALPPPRLLGYCAGLAAVAAFGFVDWPVAGVLALGHLLAEDHHHRLLHDFGQALSEA
jgi:hypothetical protein